MRDFRLRLPMILPFNLYFGGLADWIALCYGEINCYIVIFSMSYTLGIEE